MNNPFDICAAGKHTSQAAPTPSRSAIYTSTAYVCENTEVADAILSGQALGYAYQRDGHPNADLLKEKCRQLHQPDDADPLGITITSSGMAALTLAATAYLKSGDHVLLSRFLYGKTTQLIAVELSRFGITASEVDACDLEKVRQAITPTTRMLIVETISNPQLRVADIASLSTITGDNDVILLVDNTFATPIVCRPLSLGADLVLESISKFMNGHGDLMLGLLCGRQNIGDHSSWNKIDSTASTWGLASSPFDCWLAERGLATLPIRMQTAAGNAMQLADHLERVPSITNVQFPGLTQHPDHQLCRRQFASIENQTCFANMLTFELRGQRAAAEKFIRQAENIPFCPSLGEMSTTLSHPASTSHRLLNSSELKQLGISEGTIRLSVGLESIAYLQSSVNEAVAGLDS